MIPTKKITIEHILPQNPKPGSDWLDWFSPEDKEKCLHRLGNLALLSRQKNAKAGNYDFQSKKEKYFNNPVSTFALTVQVLKEKEWTPAIVEAKQRYLLEELKRVWQLEEIKEDDFAEPPPYIIDSQENKTYQEMGDTFPQFCEYVYGEPIRLIFWNKPDNKNKFDLLFRERRRGWYFQLSLTKVKGDWKPEYRVYKPFLNLLESKIKWKKLTTRATKEDWCALDQIFLSSLIYPESKIIFVSSDLICEEVADETFENFDFSYVSNEDTLPAFVFKAPNFGVRLISYFRHPDGFAREKYGERSQFK